MRLERISWNCDIEQHDQHKEQFLDARLEHDQRDRHRESQHIEERENVRQENIKVSLAVLDVRIVEQSFFYAAIDLILRKPFLDRGIEPLGFGNERVGRL